MKIVCIVLMTLVTLLNTNQIQASSRVYMQLDGHWYQTTPDNQPIWYDGTGWFSPSANMNLCHRADGQAQVFGGIGFYYSPFFYPVYQIRYFEYKPIPGDKFALKIDTEAGNIICDNEISSPIPNTIFGNGFEKDDRIFLSSFENNNVSSSYITGVTLNLSGSGIPVGCKIVGITKMEKQNGTNNILMNGNFSGCGETVQP